METETVYFARTLNRETGKLREAVVWNGLKNRVLAEFDRQGLLETTDPEVIEGLDRLGYRRVTESEIRGRGKLPPSEFAEANRDRVGTGYQTVQDPALLEQLRNEEMGRKIQPEDFTEDDDLADPIPPQPTRKRSKRSLVR